MALYDYSVILKGSDVVITDGVMSEDAPELVIERLQDAFTGAWARFYPDYAGKEVEFHVRGSDYHPFVTIPKVGKD